MREPLEVDLLQTLVAIVETGSFTAAAERIHRTQQAVSMQMRRLEQIASKPIFDRRGRNVRLTPTGETMLGYARKILDLQREAFSALVNETSTAVVRLGAPDQYIGYLLPAWLNEATVRHPRTEILLRCEPSRVLRDLIGAGELDLALVTRRADWGNIEPLRREALVWASSAHHRIHEADPLPLVLFQEGSSSRELATSALTVAGRPHHVTYTSHNFAGILPVVRAGLAVSVIPACSVPPDFRVLSAEDGFPHLPAVELGLMHSASAKGSNAVAAVLRRRAELIVA
jgi:DNA-binding transcriptional LysR family regulator